MKRDMQAEAKLVRDILVNDWNPQGRKVQDAEYDFFIWPIQKRLMAGVPREALEKYLMWGASDLIGSPVPEAKARQVAEKLIALKLIDTDPKYRS